MRAFFVNNRFLLAFAGLSSLMGISIGLAKMTTSLYSLKLGANETLLGLISAAQMVGILLMGLPVGLMVDRFGPKPLFLLGSVCAGLTYFAIPTIPSAEFLLLCTLFISFFMPLRFVSLNTIFMQQLDTVGESKAGWYRGSHMSGMFLLGPMMAPALIEHFDFDGLFYLIGLIFALTIVLAPPVLNSYKSNMNPQALTRANGFRQQLALMWRHPGLREVNLIEFFCHGMNMFYSFFIVVIAINDLRLSASEASQLVAVEGLTYVLALFFMGGLLSRDRQNNAYLCCFAAICGALAILASSQQLLYLWLGGGLLGLASGALEVINLTRYARIGAEIGRGKVAGINALAGPCGMLLASLIGGPLGQYLGLQTVFLLFIPAWLLLALRFLNHTTAPRPVPTGPRKSLQRTFTPYLVFCTSLTALILIFVDTLLPYASSDALPPIWKDLHTFGNTLLTSAQSWLEQKQPFWE